MAWILERIEVDCFLKWKFSSLLSNHDFSSYSSSILETFHWKNWRRASLVWFCRCGKSQEGLGFVFFLFCLKGSISWSFPDEFIYWIHTYWMSLFDKYLLLLLLTITVAGWSIYCDIMTELLSECTTAKTNEFFRFKFIFETILSTFELILLIWMNIRSVFERAEIFKFDTPHKKWFNFF